MGTDTEQTIPTGRTQRWVRVGLIYLMASFLSVGIWATVAPTVFFDEFPGGGRRWVAGDGPYNAHLVSDTGNGFLAVGVILALAAVWQERRLVQAALLAVIFHGLPHLVFHLRHPADSIDSTDRWASNGGIAFGTLLALVLLVAVSRTAPMTHIHDHSSTGTTDREGAAR